MGRVDPNEIGNRQQQIMQCIWEAGEHITVPEIIERLEKKYHVHLTRQAVNTFLVILQEKGFVLQGPKEGKAFTYSARITEGEFQLQELERIQKMTFKDSPSVLVATLLESDISEEEMNKIKRMIEQL